MNIRCFFSLTLSMIIITACAPTSPGKAGSRTITKTPKDFGLEFVVQGGGTKLKVVSPSQGCNKKDDGCIHVDRVNKGEITFKFKSTQQLPCSDHPSSWILSKIELADFPKSFGEPVAGWIVADFGAKASNGLVWERTDGEELVSKTISDANKNRGVAYYQLTVESCDSTNDPVATDPRIENDGETWSSF